MAAANSYSEEPLLGVVTHTARPKTLATDEGMTACVQFRHTEMMPALAKLVEAVKRFPDTSEATEPLNTAYSLAFEDSFFEHKKKRSDYMTRFVSFASAFASDETLSRILNCDIVLPEPNTIPRSKKLAFVLWI
ncbi:hypothetical protein VTI28DRAFT_688 [Corynascus sepedonium]